MRLRPSPRFYMPLHLIALAAAAFGIGTSEFVIMGLLPNVAADLDVSIDTKSSTSADHFVLNAVETREKYRPPNQRYYQAMLSYQSR